MFFRIRAQVLTEGIDTPQTYRGTFPRVNPGRHNCRAELANAILVYFEYHALIITGSFADLK